MGDKLPQPTERLVHRLQRVAKYLDDNTDPHGTNPAMAARANTCWQSAGRLEELEARILHLEAEHTRAVLHYTLKGYTAGENTDAKHWRERAESAERALSGIE